MNLRAMSLPGSQVKRGEQLPVLVTNRTEKDQSQAIDNIPELAPLPDPRMGQNINVVTNTNQHLPFREWLIRGLLGSVGNALAFPFRLIGTAISAIVTGVIGIVKIAVIIVLIPTLIWLGIMLQQNMQSQESVESGTAEMVNQAGKVVDGIEKGISNP